MAIERRAPDARRGGDLGHRRAAIAGQGAGRVQDAPPADHRVGAPPRGSVSGACAPGSSGLYAASDTGDTVTGERLRSDGTYVPTRSDAGGLPTSVNTRPGEGISGTATATMWHKCPTSIWGADMTEVTEAYGFRGRTMLDRDGDKIGKIDELYVDRRPAGPNGRWSTPVCSAPSRPSCRCTTRSPAARTSAFRSRRRTSRTRRHRPRRGAQRERGAPALHALRRRLRRRPERAIRRGRRRPRTRTAAALSRPNTDDAMTRSEEELRVGTERREAGRVRLRKYVVTEGRSA